MNQFLIANIKCGLTKLNVVNGTHSKCPHMGMSWKQGAAHAWCSSTCRLSRMQDPLEATEHHGPARKFFLRVLARSDQRNHGHHTHF